MKRELYKNIENELYSILNYYQPHIKYNKKACSLLTTPFRVIDDGKDRDFKVMITNDYMENYNLVINVSLLTDLPIYYKDLNMDIKSGTLPLDICDLISNIIGQNAIFTGFDYFDNHYSHLTKKTQMDTITEEVLDKFDSVLDKLDTRSDFLTCMTKPIGFTFLIYNYIDVSDPNQWVII
jgi:hypothetical protein